jgi:hypothetical protein
MGVTVATNWIDNISFFSQIRKRVAYLYIKKKVGGKEPQYNIT